MHKKIKHNIKEILNEVKWTKDINEVQIWYTHRGAINDAKVLSGREIVYIKKSSLDTVRSTIPYHRIFKIVYDGKIVFER